MDDEWACRGWVGVVSERHGRRERATGMPAGGFVHTSEGAREHSVEWRQGAGRTPVNSERDVLPLVNYQPIQISSN